MKRNTPDEEKKHISDSSETNNFKFISQKVAAYRHWNLGDVVVDEGSQIKYEITYICPDFRLIYGRRICLSGALSKNLHHITGMYSTFSQDAEQINAVLLGEDYDPTAKARAVSKRKREAYTQRVKQRKKVSRDHRKAKLWCKKNLKVGDIIWITSNQTEDREADQYEYTVASIDDVALRLKDTHNVLHNIGLKDLYGYNIYRTRPVVYKEIP